MRHPAFVRVTHWINAVSFAGLTVSGTAILLAHPRLYWGETGTVGVPALLELPLPFVFGHSGWGRSLHFLAAWMCVLTGLAYAVQGLWTRHFSFGYRCYTALQRAAYLGVVFVLFPLVLWTGLAMSPTVTAVAPAVVVVLGGQQSARTIHFAAAVALLVFAVGHIAAVWRSGLVGALREMTIGGARKEGECT